MKATWLVVLAACGDNLAAAPDASTACVATLSGNFAEQSSSAEACPMLAGGTLQLELPVVALDGPLTIDIGLGVPTPGLYTSGNAGEWSAFALHKIGNQACAYSAGSAAVPQGAFELALERIDPPAIPHGTLRLTLVVLTFPNSQCGDGETEQLDLAF